MNNCKNTHISVRRPCITILKFVLLIQIIFWYVYKYELYILII